MSLEQLTREAMALPLAERAELAQTLWQSIHEAPLHGGPDEDSEMVAVALRRKAELEAGDVRPVTHEEVMRAARQALEWK